MCAYNEDVITDTVDTVFPQLVPAGIINLVFLADADTKQGRIAFEGGYYLACSHMRFFSTQELVFHHGINMKTCTWWVWCGYYSRADTIPLINSSSAATI